MISICYQWRNRSRRQRGRHTNSIGHERPACPPADRQYEKDAQKTGDGHHGAEGHYWVEKCDQARAAGAAGGEQQRLMMFLTFEDQRAAWQDLL